MNYIYPKIYKPVSLEEQQAILTKHFKIKKSQVPVFQATLPGAEAVFVIPHWTLLGKTYEKSLQRVLEAIKSTRSFYNYRDGR